MNSDWKKLRRFAMHLFPAGYAERVCRAWHRTGEVKVLAPGEFILSNVEGPSRKLGTRQRREKGQVEDPGL